MGPVQFPGFYKKGLVNVLHRSLIPMCSGNPQETSPLTSISDRLGWLPTSFPRKRYFRLAPYSHQYNHHFSGVNRKNSKNENFWNNL
jgi:hypothetical protein